MRVIKCHHIQVPSGKRMPTATALEWHKPTGFEQWTSELPGTPLIQYDNIARADNGFIDAACKAYSHHLPLVLNPWHVWIVILQNVSKYVNDHSEQVRHLIVAHEGKKEICVNSGGIVGGIVGNFEIMCRDCKLDLGVDLSLNSRPEDCVARTVMQLAALDTVKTYFSYSATFGCGVPEYHVEGTHADWQQLIDKAQQFAQLGPEVSDWVSELVPVLQQIQTSEDPEFWTCCCTLSRIGSGGQQAIDGWILAFYLYCNEGFVRWAPRGSARRANLAEEYIRLDKQYWKLNELRNELWDDTSQEGKQRFNELNDQCDNLRKEIQQKCGPRSIQDSDLNQTSLSCVPFTVTDSNGIKYDVEIHSGLVCAAQDADTGAVRPLPGYVVWRKPAA